MRFDLIVFKIFPYLGIENMLLPILCKTTSELFGVENRNYLNWIKHNPNKKRIGLVVELDNISIHQVGHKFIQGKGRVTFNKYILQDLYFPTDDEVICVMEKFNSLIEYPKSFSLLN